MEALLDNVFCRSCSLILTMSPDLMIFLQLMEFHPLDLQTGLVSVVIKLEASHSFLIVLGSNFETTKLVFYSDHQCFFCQPFDIPVVHSNFYAVAKNSTALIPKLTNTVVFVLRKFCIHIPVTKRCMED